MADDLRNRVARAIAGSDGVDWDAASSIQREEYSDNADAALAEMGAVRVNERTARKLRDAVDMAELDHQSEVEDAASTGERPDLWLWEVGIPLPCAQEILAAIEPAPVSVREAARVLLGVKAGDKLDTIAGHALVKGNFWEGYRAVLRAIAEGKDDE